MNENNVELFLKDFSRKSKFEFVEYSNDNEELKNVAKKARIELPSPDVAFFKCIYLVMDKQNKNNCILPSEEVQKALPTLIGKRITADHKLKIVVGHWVDAYVQDDKIIAWGVFFKSSFTEDYQKIKKMFEKGNLTVSMESWGVREFNKDKSYNLKELHFCGGGILLNTVPAEEEAHVLELSQEKILEFAMQATEEDKFLKFKDKKLELSRFYQWDFGTILRLVQEVKCENCQSKDMEDTHETYWKIDVVDFENGYAKASCFDCNYSYIISVSPQVVGEIPAQEDASRKILKIEGLNKKDSSDKETSEVKLIMEKELLELKDKVKSLEEAMKSKDAEIVTLTASVATAAKALEDAKVNFETEKASAIEKAKADAIVITTRKAELADFAKDMTDEDILNDIKFENAKLKKEVASLKAKPVKSTETAALATGTKSDETDPIELASSRVSAHVDSLRGR